MGRVTDFFVRRRAKRAARQARRAADDAVQAAASNFFQREHPEDRILWGTVYDRTETDAIVGITYDADLIPPPIRFFRVVRGGEVSECPPEFLPEEFDGPYR